MLTISFSEVLDVNIENLCIDLYCWFDKSSKRKGKLAEYFEFCDQVYKSILKHASVCWLSLERCMDRILHKQPRLKAYFYQGVLVTKGLKDIMIFFELISYCKEMNQPFTYLRASIDRLAKGLTNRAVEPEALRSMKSIIDLDLNDENIFLDPKNTYLGLQTNSKLKALLNEGGIPNYPYKKFHETEYPYYRCFLDYIQKKMFNQ